MFLWTFVIWSLFCNYFQRVWVLKESQCYFEEMRAKYSKTGEYDQCTNKDFKCHTH